MRYAYQSEKLAQARRCLMIPHPRGVPESIADAFHECSLAFHGLDESGLDDNARRWVDQIRGFMNTDGLRAEGGEGTWLVKARTLTEDDQFTLASAVDELAHWFNRDFWSAE